jgi:hypothetical protein
VIVVFDTNIWLSELALASPGGAAVRFYLHKKCATLAIPEVVRLELQRNLRRNLRQWRDEVKTGHGRLLAVFGRLKELVLPTDDDIEKKVGGVFDGLGVPVVNLPFTLQAARASLLRTIDKLPPSDKEQQFKDGVIWADCVGLLDQDDVYLVTADKAFFEDRIYERGLSSSLRKDLVGASHKLTLLPRIADLLSDLREEVKIGEDVLSEQFLARSKDSIDGMLSANGFVLGRRTATGAKLFATEKAATLYVDFTLTYECDDIRNEGRSGVKLELAGDGLFDVDSGTFGDLRNRGGQLVFTDQSGERHIRHHYYLGCVDCMLGHRQIQYSVRFPLD